MTWQDDLNEAFGGLLGPSVFEPSPPLAPVPVPADPTLDLAAALRELTCAVKEQATGAPEWLDAPAAAKHLGLPSLKALYQLVRGGDVPAHKLGRRLRFARADLDAVIRGGALSRRTTAGR